MKADLSHYEDEWSAALYDFQSEKRLDDVALWSALAQRTGGPVLELACGSARAILPLAREGYEVAGLDLSPHMLAIARRRLAAETPEVRSRTVLREGDMADFALDRAFGLIFMTSRTFQALLTRDDQRRCLQCCRRHLKPGGLVAIDVFNTRLARLVVPGGVEEKPDQYHGPDGEEIKETGRSDYDLANQTLVWRARYESTLPNGTVRIREYATRLHYFFRFEMEWMLEACGFEVEAVYGNFDRNPFTAESPEMVFVARRGN